MFESDRIFPVQHRYLYIECWPTCLGSKLGPFTSVRWQVWFHMASDTLVLTWDPVMKMGYFSTFDLKNK